MKVLISPTKTLRRSTVLRPETLPEFLEEAKELHAMLKQCDKQELMKGMKIKESMADTVMSDLEAMKFSEDALCAVEAFDGLQYKRLDVSTLDDRALQWLKKHVRIVSGLYGLLRPFDSMEPYRLDFNMKWKLYDFWGERLAKALGEDDILDISSSEFTKAIEPYINPERYTKVYFKEFRDGKWKILSTSSKIMRGRLVRHMARKELTIPKDITGFSEEGFHWREDLSGEGEIVFGREC